VAAGDSFHNGLQLSLPGRSMPWDTNAPRSVLLLTDLEDRLARLARIVIGSGLRAEPAAGVPGCSLDDEIPDNWCLSCTDVGHARPR
jgi:hypothetical protein